MKALLQRVSQGAVEVLGEGRSDIGKGLVVLFGVEKGDSAELASRMAAKILQFRVFENDQERMALSVQEIRGDILIVSQFTLCSDNRKGSKPSFDPAAPPAEAEKIYTHFVETLRASGLKIATGKFGAPMRVHIVNEGPATFWLTLP